MKFPRLFVNVGECIAVTRAMNWNEENSGQPILHKRSGIRYKGEVWKASRLSYHLNVEKIPRTPKKFPNGLVLHTCDSVWCINPKHLYFGTQKDNVRDMYDRHPTIRESISKAGTGKKRSKVTRKRISIGTMGNQNCLGRIISEETRLKQSVSNFGKKRSEKTKRRLRAAWKRTRESRRMSDENKRLLSIRMKGNKYALKKEEQPCV